MQTRDTPAAEVVVALDMLALPCRVVVGFETASAFDLAREHLFGRISSARLPALAWTLEASATPDIFIAIERRSAKSTYVRFTGPICSPTYEVELRGLHWDFSKVLTALAFERVAQHGAVPLHAACLRGTDAVVLMPGGSGAGKSSVSLAALAAGHDVLASELAFLRAGVFTVGNDRITIDPGTVESFSLSVPPTATREDGRIIIDINGTTNHEVSRVIFPKVAATALSVRSITPRRARMLLFENAVSQLGVSQLLWQETWPLGLLPNRLQLEAIARCADVLSGCDPVIAEGHPSAVADFALGGSP